MEASFAFSSVVFEVVEDFAEEVTTILTKLKAAGSLPWNLKMNFECFADVKISSQAAITTKH